MKHEKLNVTPLLTENSKGISERKTEIVNATIALTVFVIIFFWINLKLPEDSSTRIIFEISGILFTILVWAILFVTCCKILLDGPKSKSRSTILDKLKVLYISTNGKMYFGYELLAYDSDGDIIIDKTDVEPLGDKHNENESQVQIEAIDTYRKTVQLADQEIVERVRAMHIAGSHERNKQIQKRIKEMHEKRPDVTDTPYYIHMEKRRKQLSHEIELLETKHRNAMVDLKRIDDDVTNKNSVG